jgi:hypothetical protein
MDRTLRLWYGHAKHSRTHGDTAFLNATRVQQPPAKREGA